MATLLLVVIYAAFISLGLPDPLLGAAWPVMVSDLGVATSAAGAISMTISGGTILSALLSGRLLAAFGAAKVTVVSTFVTAAALAGFAISPGLFWLILVAAPLGLGAGAIDTGINDFVARHYRAHHMNWLHSFWGVGAMAGPLIIAGFLRGGEWRAGYATVSTLQFGLLGILLLSLPLWKKVADADDAPPARETGANPPGKGLLHALKLDGVTQVLLVFLFYCGVEWTMGIWGSTFLVREKGIEPATAARWASLFYGSIMVGRMVSGFVSMRLSSATIIRIGEIVILLGVGLLFLPGPGALSMVAFILIGLGCAPIFPTMIHETPNYFGPEHAGYAIGLQMAVAYTGSTFLPPLFGIAADAAGFLIFPWVLLGFGVLMLFYSRQVNRFARHRRKLAHGGS